MSKKDKDRAKHSLFWYGDLRECPELEGSEAEREAKEELEYWGLYENEKKLKPCPKYPCDKVCQRPPEFLRKEGYYCPYDFNNN